MDYKCDSNIQEQIITTSKRIQLSDLIINKMTLGFSFGKCKNCNVDSYSLQYIRVQKFPLYLMVQIPEKYFAIDTAKLETLREIPFQLILPEYQINRKYFTGEFQLNVNKYSKLSETFPYQQSERNKLLEELMMEELHENLLDPHSIAQRSLAWPFIVYAQ